MPQLCTEFLAPSLHPETDKKQITIGRAFINNSENVQGTFNRTPVLMEKNSVQGVINDHPSSSLQWKLEGHLFWRAFTWLHGSFLRRTCTVLCIFNYLTMFKTQTTDRLCCVTTTLLKCNMYGKWHFFFNQILRDFLQSALCMAWVHLSTLVSPVNSNSK